MFVIEFLYNCVKNKIHLMKYFFFLLGNKIYCHYCGSQLSSAVRMVMYLGLAVLTYYGVHIPSPTRVINVTDSQAERTTGQALLG